MTRLLSLAAFILGALVILWMGVAVAAGHLLASVVMLLIALAYFTGGAELLRYQQATGALHAALAQGGDVELNRWLDALPASLRNPVRQRIEGEYVGLPVPVLTPYLVGLLVMLGLMGTFVGMVETLGGAVQALEGSTELSAIRDGLTTPIKGLGMAFGTSVAGVAASAMLGFIATLSRRERIEVSRELDQQRDSRFRNYSLSHQRQQTYSALQQQADALPTVASQLTALSERLGAMGEQLSQQLLDNQQQFQQSVQQDFQSLANAVAESLNRSLADSGRQAGETIKPVVEGLLAGLERDLQQRHQQFDEAANARLEAMSSQLEQSAATIDSTWQKGLENQQRANRELADAVGQRLSSSAEQMAREAEAAEAPDAADFLETLEPDSSVEVVHTMDDEAAADALAHMQAPLAASVVEVLPPEEAAGYLDKMDPDDAVDILQQLDKTDADAILAQLPARRAAALSKLALYEPETAGGLMTTKVVRIPDGWSVAEAVTRIRRSKDDDDKFFYVYCVDDRGALTGVVNLRDLLLAEPETPITDIVSRDLVALRAGMDQEDVAREFDRYDHYALPVLDENDRLLGVVTIDDVIDAIRAEHTEDALKQVGAGAKEVVTDTVRGKLRARAPWLVVNLGAALIAALVILQFEGSIEALPLLAVLMPVIANQAGNGGQQSLAITLRGLVLGEVRRQRVGSGQTISSSHNVRSGCSARSTSGHARYGAIQ